MTIDEEINRFERLASDYEFNLEMHQHNVMKLSVNDIERMKMYAQENRQLAEWLRELKERREIQDILLQFIVDDETDICCDELAEDEEEWEICEKTCNNHTKECWIRWAKMKARR